MLRSCMGADVCVEHLSFGLGKHCTTLAMHAFPVIIIWQGIRVAVDTTVLPAALEEAGQSISDADLRGTLGGSA